jgi:hypothetical protein
VVTIKKIKKLYSKTKELVRKVALFYIFANLFNVRFSNLLLCPVGCDITWQVVSGKFHCMLMGE